MRWLKDEEFIRGSIPMTKFDVRVLIMAMLEFEKDDVFLDVGAGTGSISVQAARLGASVYAIEKKEEGTLLIKKNADKLGVDIKVIHGTAPFNIDAIPNFNKCFVGGSSGQLEEILNAVDKKLKTGGILAGSFIIPDNMVDFKRKLKELKYKDIEVKLVQSSNMDSIGLFKANNPIYIIKAKKL